MNECRLGIDAVGAPPGTGGYIVVDLGPYPVIVYSDGLGSWQWNYTFPGSANSPFGQPRDGPFPVHNCAYYRNAVAAGSARWALPSDVSHIV